MKKVMNFWHFFAPGIKATIVAGLFSLLGALVGASLKPSVGRYALLNYNYPDYDLFDTATGKMYYWRRLDGGQGLSAIDAPIDNKVYGLVGKEWAVSK